jgi:hypothetical protein
MPLCFLVVLFFRVVVIFTMFEAVVVPFVVVPVVVVPVVVVPVVAVPVVVVPVVAEQSGSTLAGNEPITFPGG